MDEEIKTSVIWLSHRVHTLQTYLTETRKTGGQLESNVESFSYASGKTKTKNVRKNNSVDINNW